MEKTEKKFSTGIEYKNSKYRPNVLISKEKEELIKNHYQVLGFKTFNEWINFVIDRELSGKNWVAVVIGCRL